MYQANSDQNSVVVNTLIKPVEARFIRLNIEEWHGHISMRFELYGCDVDAGGSILLLLLYLLWPIFFLSVVSMILERFANDTCYGCISM